jgi:hypothetical protein
MQNVLTAEAPRQFDHSGLDFDVLIDADTIPELQAARQQAAQQAGIILARNRQLLASGQPEAAPIEVDVLGTASRLVVAKDKYGVDSLQYKELDKGLELDCERVIGEAERKLTWEYFGDALQKQDKETGQYTAHGVPLSEVVTSGLTPHGKPEEQDRRVNEYVEEMGTYVGLGRMVKSLGGTAVSNTISSYTISECTDFAIEDYAINPKGSHRGYVPEIKKFMTRDVTFDAETGNRVERQLALSGVYITRDVIMNVLAGFGAISEGQTLSKTELHGKQLIDPSSKGIVWFAEQLDKEASKQSGKRIFMGEAVAQDHPMNYESVPIEAEARRVKLAPKPRELADYLITLQENGTDKQVAEGLVNAYLKKMLLEVASSDPDKAEVMFDKATAEGFRAVAALQALGRDQDADWLRSEIEKNAPDVSYCGAGSCGLESVASNAAEALKAKALGLKGELLHDTERSCPGCNEKKIYYDKEGNKACTGCGLTHTKGKVSKAKK